MGSLAIEEHFPNRASFRDTFWPSEPGFYVYWSPSGGDGEPDENIEMIALPVDDTDSEPEKQLFAHMQNNAAPFCNFRIIETDWGKVAVAELQGIEGMPIWQIRQMLPEVDWPY